jgi:Crp-like helix-turn-helix domain
MTPGLLAGVFLCLPGPSQLRQFGAAARSGILAGFTADLMIRDSDRRCAAALLRLAGCRYARPQDITPVEVPLTQNELAGAANLSRNSVGKMLQRLEKRGFVEVGYGAMTVRNPAPCERSSIKDNVRRMEQSEQAIAPRPVSGFRIVG